MFFNLVFVCTEFCVMIDWSIGTSMYECVFCAYGCVRVVVLRDP
jgi:hypothetical protein